jgi:hypothetical protein
MAAPRLQAGGGRWGRMAHTEVAVSRKRMQPGTSLTDAKPASSGVWLGITGTFERPLRAAATDLQEAGEAPGRPAHTHLFTQPALLTSRGRWPG